MRRFHPGLLLLLTVTAACSSPPDHRQLALARFAISNGPVISGVYAYTWEGTTPSAKKKFIEIFNPTPTPVDMNGWSVQTFRPDLTGWDVVYQFGGSLGPGQYFLIALIDGSVEYTNVPNPPPYTFPIEDIQVDFTRPIHSLALVNRSTSLVCLDVGCSNDVGLVDLLATTEKYGYYYETAPFSGAPSVSSGLFRKNRGCVDTNDNSLDFELMPYGDVYTAANLQSPRHSCSTSDADADTAVDADDAIDDGGNATDLADDALDDSDDALDDSDGAIDDANGAIDDADGATDDADGSIGDTDGAIAPDDSGVGDLPSGDLLLNDNVAPPEDTAGDDQLDAPIPDDQFTFDSDALAPNDDLEQDSEPLDSDAVPPSPDLAGGDLATPDDVDAVVPDQQTGGDIGPSGKSSGGCAIAPRPEPPLTPMILLFLLLVVRTRARWSQKQAPRS